MRGCTVSRYEQFETSPEMIEQELQFANSDRFKENYLLVFVNADMHVRAHVHIPVWNTRRSLTCPVYSTFFFCFNVQMYVRGPIIIISYLQLSCI